MAYVNPKQNILLYELHTCVHNNGFLDSTTASLKSSMSYIDFTRTFSQNSLNSRTCKSQRSLLEQLKLDRRELLINWIHDIFNNEDKRKMWNKRLIKIAKKLKKPSGEIELRKNIENFLKNKDTFDANVDTDYIINYIIELIKDVETNKRHYNVFHAEVMSHLPHRSYLRNVIKEWIRKLPIKKIDSFGRPVDKNNIINIATNTLLLEINDINTHCIGNMKKNILNALSDIPVDITFDERTTILKRNVNMLIKLLLDAEDEVIDSKIYLPREDNNENNMDMRSFISIKISEMLDLYPLPLQPQNINYVKLKLVNMISKKLNFGKLQRNRVKEDIYYILTSATELSRWKINKYTNIFINYLDNVFDGFIADDTKANWIDVILNACNSESHIKKAKNKVKRSNNNMDDVHLKRQLTDKISEWLEGFKCNTPELKDKNYITIAAKDLSSSIIGRYKFLQHYPNKASTRREIEFLKYLIIIWLNKIIGRNSSEILKHVNVLLEKIIGFQNGFRVKAAKSEEICRKRSTFSKINLIKKNSEYLKNVIHDVPAEFDNLQNCDTEVKQSNTSKDLMDSSKLITKPRSLTLITLADLSVKIKDPTFKSSPMIKKEVTESKQQKERTDIPWLKNKVIDYNVCVFSNKACSSDCKPIQCLYNHYSNILTSHCNELQLDSLPVDKQEVIKRIILNTAWKIYYRLISDLQTEKNNFKTLFDEQFEESLSDTQHIQDLNHLLDYQINWKKKLSNLVNSMYHHVQDIKNGIKFRQTFEDVIRKELRLTLQPHQEILLMKILDHYVMYSKYKENKVFKAYIYRQRLLQSIELLITDNNIKSVTTEIIRQEIFKIFENVADDILESEAKEVVFREELDAWLKPFSSEKDTQSYYLGCHKEIIVLAKNVNTISKIYSDKTLAADEIKKEIEKFLATEIQNNRYAPDSIDAVKDFVNKWQTLDVVIKSDNQHDQNRANVVIKKGLSYVNKVESHVHFKDLPSDCNTLHKAKKAGILKEPKARNGNPLLIDTDRKSENSHNGNCRGCNIEVIGYKENVHLDGSDHSLTIINDIPPFISTGLQADLPVCEGTNTEHLFLPKYENLRKPNISKPLYVVDKFSQTSLDRCEARNGVYCQKCKVLIENNMKNQWSDISDSDYDDTESY